MFWLGFGIGSVITFLLIVIISSLVVASRADRRMGQEEE